MSLPPSRHWPGQQTLAQCSLALALAPGGATLAISSFGPANCRGLSGDRNRRCILDSQCRSNGFARNSLAEQPPLTIGASQKAQAILGARVFDAFRCYWQVQRSSERQD